MYWWQYLVTFLVAMVPVVELRGALPMGEAFGIPIPINYLLCIVGNMLPVPIIYFFARKVLQWGADKKYTARFFRFCLEKGEHAGQKLVKKAGRGGLFLALMLFVGIPLPGTGAWTGALGASFLKMGIRSTALAVSLGVIIAGIIMTILTHLGLHIFGY